MLLKIGFLAGIGVIASLGALYWIEPQTAGGQTLLAVIVFAIVNGIGSLFYSLTSRGRT